MNLQLLQGDVLDGLRALPSQSVHCVVTSPPYWSLRDYGLPRTIWPGDNPTASTCTHVWGESRQLPKITHWNSNGHFDPEARSTVQEAAACGEFCARCGVWRGCLGLEPTMALYVAHMVSVFDALWRVLRDDGTLWLNLGDCYIGSGCGEQGEMGEMAQKRVVKSRIKPNRTQFSQSRHLHADFEGPNRNGGSGLPPKSLAGIPWRVAFALQDAGWTLRQEIIWAKQNPMPESVRDRPTRAHEQIFLFSKGPKYFYDAEAISEPVTGNAHSRGRGDYRKARLCTDKRVKSSCQFARAHRSLVKTRNKRSVWSLPVARCNEAHFATFPTKLVEPCVLASTSAFGCCGECGAPYRRRIERRTNWQSRKALGAGAGNLGVSKTYQNAQEKAHYLGGAKVRMMGWEPTCRCANSPLARCTVLDPFSGAGTTAMVALDYGRNAIGIELNPEYAAISKRRITKRMGMFADIQIVLLHGAKMEVTT